MTTPWMALLVALAALVLLAVLLGRSNRRLARHAAQLIRKRRQQHLRKLDQRAIDKATGERYWRHMRRAPAPVLISTPQGELVAANDALLWMLGYESEDELRERGPGALFFDPLDRDLKAPLSLVESEFLHSGELRLRRKDDGCIEALINLRIVRHEMHGEVYEAVITDITQLRQAMESNRRLEEQLHLARKLEAVGQLAAGIAHEINTPIQFVGDNVHFLRDACRELIGVLDSYRGILRSTEAPARDRLERLLERVDTKAALPDLLNDVQKALEASFEGISRVAEIVKAMKEFAHPGTGERAAADLNALLNNALVMARNEYKQVADIKLELADIPPVWCRRGDINKVFLNIIVNAAHAIEAHSAQGRPRGLISVTTRHVEDSVHVVVADTGCGMSAELQTRVFDPFFTTKPVGKGTGQGLAIARGIVDSHGGQIRLASATGAGTTFTIVLPVAGNVSTREATGIAA